MLKPKMGIHEAALAAAATVALAAGGQAVAAEIGHTALQRCPFSAAELAAATGLKVELVPLMTMAGAPQPMSAPSNGAMFLSCSATDGAVSASLLVTQQWFEPKTAAARIQALRQRDFKAAEPVPGDPDGAWWLNERQGAKQALYYVRGGHVLVMASVNGVPQPLQAGLRNGLLKLRRVP